MERISLGVVMGVLLAAAPARAVVQVRYEVDLKAVKKVATGTSVTYELYTDQACPAPAVVSTTAPIEDARVEQPKLILPKGSAKAPKSATLFYDFPYSGGDQPLYLKVVASGIVPVGGDCQLQRFGPDQVADAARLGGVPASQWVQACSDGAVYARAQVDGATSTSDFAETGISGIFSCIGEGALVRRTALGVYDVVFDDGGSDTDNIGIRFDLLGRTPMVTSQTVGASATISGPFQCAFDTPPEVTCYRVETRDTSGNPVEARFSIAFL